MLGFLALIFLYLFIVLARNTEKSSRSSLVRSLIMAGLFLLVLSLFSVVTLGVLFLFILFIPFFFFPSSRSHTQFHFRKDKSFEDFFEEMQRGQQRQNESRHRSYETSPKGMSVYDAASLLGISPDATIVQIKSAYRKLMLKHHPDKGGSAEYAAKLNMARDVMMAYVSSKRN